MESFGEYLTRERELRNIELDEIAQITKIKLRFLQALESDTFCDLPNETFVRGFLKAYARHVGLDEHDILLRYESFQRTFEEKGEDRSTSRFPTTKGLSRQWIIIGGIVLLMMAGGGLICLLSKPYDSFTSSYESHSSGTLPSVILPPDFPASLRGTESDPEGREKQVLEFQTLKDLDIKISIDGGPLERVSLKRGEMISWLAYRGFEVIIPDPGAVRVALNGEKITLDKAGNEEVHIQLPLYVPTKKSDSSLPR